MAEDVDIQPEVGRAIIHRLRKGAGKSGVASIEEMLFKLRRLREVGLPADLFAGTSPKIHICLGAATLVQKPFQIEHHPDRFRYSLLASFVFEKLQISWLSFSALWFKNSVEKQNPK